MTVCIASRAVKDEAMDFAVVEAWRLAEPCNYFLMPGDEFICFHVWL